MVAKHTFKVWAKDSHVLSTIGCQSSIGESHRHVDRFLVVCCFAACEDADVFPRKLWVHLHVVDVQTVGTLKDEYVRKVPLPRAPRIQRTSHVTTVSHNTCYLAQVPRIPRWSDLARSLAGLRSNILPFPPVWLMQ